MLNLVVIFFITGLMKVTVARFFTFWVFVLKILKRWVLLDWFEALEKLILLRDPLGVFQFLRLWVHICMIIIFNLGVEQVAVQCFKIAKFVIFIIKNLLNVSSVVILYIVMVYKETVVFYNLFIEKITGKF